MGKSLVELRANKGKMAKENKMLQCANTVPGWVFYHCVHNGWTRA
jgi:hypothetical protein